MSGLIPKEGRLAGIDFGTVRIGVAICDPSQTLCSPYENYNRRTESKDALYFQSLTKEERIVGWIVGLPLHLDGRDSKKSEEAKAFGKWLEQQTEIPVEFFDERFTSSFANDALAEVGMSQKKRKKRLDMLAAQMILSSFLDARQTD